MDVAAVTGFFLLLVTVRCFPQDGMVFSPPGSPCTTNEGLEGTCESLFACHSAVTGNRHGIAPTKCPGPFQVLVCCSYEVPSVTEKPEDPPSHVGDSCSTGDGATGTCKNLFSCPGSANDKCPGPVASLVCCVERTEKPEELPSQVGDSCSTKDGATGTCKNLFGCSGTASGKCPGPIASLVCCVDRPPVTPDPVTQTPKLPESLIGDPCVEEDGAIGTCNTITLCSGDARSQCPGTVESVVCCVDKNTSATKETPKPGIISQVGDQCFSVAGNVGTCKNIFSCADDLWSTKCPGPVRSLVCCIDPNSPSGPTTEITEEPTSVAGDACLTDDGEIGTCKNIFRCPGLSLSSITKCPGPITSLVCCAEPTN